MFGFEIDRKAVVSKGARGRGTDGADDNGLTEDRAQRLFMSIFICNLKHMFNLLGRREQDRDDFSGENLLNCIAERPTIFGQCPAIDRYARDEGTSLGETVKQLLVRLSILLDCEPQAGDRNAGVDQCEGFPPGVGSGTWKSTTTTSDRRADAGLGPRAITTTRASSCGQSSSGKRVSVASTK